MGTNIVGLRQLRAVLLGCAVALASSSADAQDAQPATVTLETIDVNPTSTRLSTAVPSRAAQQRERQRRPAPAAGPSEPATPGAVVLEQPSGIVTNTTITGASTTVITATDIERAPGQTIQDVLARQPGIQTRSLFGAVNGAATAVDLRGFGATATANTLVLVNGRRLNEDRYTVQLVDDRERLRSLDKSTLREYEVLETGVMPSYAQSLTAEERADVLAYLLTLKGLP